LCEAWYLYLFFLGVEDGHVNGERWVWNFAEDKASVFGREEWWWGACRAGSRIDNNLPALDESN
jgi:hypothetical protein